jgi:heme A synthase
MPFLALRGEADELVRFRRLLDATILTTFALIVIGGVVRVSDSGLGCGAAGSGTKGWPLCGGRILPFLQENAVIEFSHRAAATVVVVLIALLVVQSLRRLRNRRWLVRGSLAAGALVLAQAALGGLTVEHGLHSALVAAHLGLAMLLLALLIALRRLAQPEAALPVDGSGALRAAAVVAAALLFATIVAGGYVAGTEEEGVRNGAVNGAHLACGEEFPGCLGGVLPFGRHGHLVDVQLTHRALVYVTTLTALGLLGLALYRRAWSREFTAVAGLLAVQLALGALNIWLGKHPGLIIAHLTTGTLLWAAAVSTVLRLSPAPEPRARPRASEPETSAAPA